MPSWSSFSSLASSHLRSRQETSPFRWQQTKLSPRTSMTWERTSEKQAPSKRRRHSLPREQEEWRTLYWPETKGSTRSNKNWTKKNEKTALNSTLINWAEPLDLIWMAPTQYSMTTATAVLLPSPYQEWNWSKVECSFVSLSKCV